MTAAAADSACDRDAVLSYTKICQANPGPRLERRQPERVASTLDAEHAEQEAVHCQDDSTPDEDGDLLGARVCHTRDFEREADSREGENAV